MGRIEADVERMLWEGCPNVTEPVVKNSRFPERNGRIRFGSVLELGMRTDSKGPADWSLFKSEMEMVDGAADRKVTRG